jgi:PAS domain S-box-containing protein
VGLGLDETRSAGWQAAIHPEDREGAVERWARSVETGEPFEATYRMRQAADGEYRWFLSRAVAMRDADGRIEKWFGTSTDVHEQKRAEAERAEALEREREARRQAEEANRAKDEFLAVVSHELRTPLNSMLGWARLLRSDKIDAASFERGLETIERNVRSQAQLIDDLLDVSRIVTGKLRLDVQPVEVASCVRAAIDSMRIATEAKRIRLEATLDPTAGPVSGDPDRLQQIAWNLLSNAIKFTPKDGTVRVRVACVDSHVEIVVADSGQGISPEFLPFVFDRFRQADASITRSAGGLGLGLAIVRHLVELHGGSVRAESEGEGRGATFTVTLPLMPIERDGGEIATRAPREVETASSLLECPPELAGVKILVVDDEPDAREMLKAMLEGCEAEARTVASAAEALQLLDVWAPDLLVSDIGMPGEDGYALIKRVRERGPARSGNVPAVALTAYARYEDRMRALGSGFQMHVAKPVDPAELLLVIHSLLKLKMET